MVTSALERFVGDVRADWGSLSTQVVAACRHHLEQLARAPSNEPWLAALHRDRPKTEELYRDPAHGFVLLAHAEQAGLYRPPHDHGRSWVIYAVQDGDVEMSTYARVEDPEGAVRLVQRDSTLVRAGQVQVYLPGDIHDTRCMSETALLFRFTERDLRVEDRQEGHVIRYVERNGVWTVGGAMSVTAEESRRPIRSGLSQPSRTLAIASVLSAMSLVVLDAGMVNVGLPTLARALESSLRGRFWWSPPTRPPW